MKPLLSLSLLLFVCLQELALGKGFNVGEGSLFQYTSAQGERADLSIYISESSFTKLGVEYYFITRDLIKSEMWQQYIFKMDNGKSLNLENGYLFSSEMKAPEKIKKEMLNVNEGGVRLEDFFFSSMADLEKFKVGFEKIEVPAGIISTQHFQKKKGEQVIDFWISDNAGVIGLVKLVSKGPNNSKHNYTVELKSLLKNVKPKIIPAN